MAQLPPVKYDNFKNGLITEGAVSRQYFPDDAVTESLNFHFDRLGCATLRPGLTLLGNQLSGNLLGLYEFRDSGSGSNNQIIAVNGTTAYYLSGGTWTSTRAGLTSGSNAEFATFVDQVFMVNSTEATAFWTGASGDSWSTSGNASSAPTGKYIENFRSRLWIAGNLTNPDRLFYSSNPTSTGSITWDTSSTGQWIDISPSDGENLTGLKRSKSYLLVFKPNHIYRVASITSTEPDPVINVGTWSHRSIVDAKDGIYFHHPTGFFKYVDGGAREISLPIVDIVKNITLANYSKITGWSDGDHLYWAVGNVTINGVTYTNIVVRYTISSETWTHYSYPRQFLCASPYNDGTTLFRLVGDDNGNVLKVNVGNTDNSTAISYSFATKPYTLDGLDSTRKTISKMLMLHEGGTGSSVQFQIEGDNRSDWSKTIGQLSDIDTLFTSANIKGRRIKFRISGSSTGEPFAFFGVEVLMGTDELALFS